MGSDSDWSVMEDAAQALAEFDVPVRGRRGVGAPHARPRCSTTRATAAGRGIEVIIAGAGGAAHLPGMVASATPLPVIGVPVPLAQLDGLDSLLSIVQMPAGRAGGHGVDRRRPQRRPAGRAHPRRRRMPQLRTRIVAVPGPSWPRHGAGEGCGAAGRGHGEVADE